MMISSQRQADWHALPLLLAVLCLINSMLNRESHGQSATGGAANTTGQANRTKVTLRVLSYNIHHAEGVDGKLDLERIAAIIKRVKPDIVALQEVDQKVTRSNTIDQPVELAKMTGLKSGFGGNINLQGGKYGNAILTRGDFVLRDGAVDSTNHQLPNIDKGEQRGVLDCKIEIDGVPLRVMATHFDHRRDSRERMLSISKVNELATAGGELPTLLIGDLNAEFESDVLSEARQVWTVANDKRLPTIPVTNPQRQIDFILTYPANRWTVKEVQVLDEQVASDHRPILAVLEL